MKTTRVVMKIALAKQSENTGHRRMNVSNSPIRILLLCSLFFCCCCSQGDGDVISVHPRGSFLRWGGSENALEPLIVDLSLLSTPVFDGDTIRIDRLGDWASSQTNQDQSLFMIGCFSASDVLLSGHLINRIQDAIEAGPDVVTPNTANGNLATDFPEDFLISNGDGSISGLNIEVPTGANYLFVAVSDIYFFDNHDPDGDFAVSINSIPEPTTPIMVIAAVLPFVWFGRRRRRATCR